MKKKSLKPVLKLEEEQIIIGTMAFSFLNIITVELGLGKERPYIFPPSVVRLKPLPVLEQERLNIAVEEKLRENQLTHDAFATDIGLKNDMVELDLEPNIEK